jgi:hypothetical protein
MWHACPSRARVAKEDKARMFFSEEKNQKTFASSAGSTIRDMAGEVGAVQE